MRWQFLLLLCSMVSTRLGSARGSVACGKMSLIESFIRGLSKDIRVC